MDIEDLSSAELQAIFHVTPQSIARHCGLLEDPSNPDVRSEERRIVDLERQLGLMQTVEIKRTLLSLVEDLPIIRDLDDHRRGMLEVRSVPDPGVLFSEFSAIYLPALVAKYRKHTTPHNTATTAINVLCHLPYFVRFQRTPAASDLVILQATRVASIMVDPEPKIIGTICQFIFILFVLQGTNEIPEDIKQNLISKFDRWRRAYKGQFAGETSDRCYQILQGNPDMAVNFKTFRDKFERPLVQCGVQGCDRRVDSDGPELKQCSRCKTAVYCGAAHQKEHWAKHKKMCYTPTF
ncbi:hypothetical protein OG21DRAFT_1602756 [Imleria badia]|nr:hypothetical protein OG21DRAFT_1602756 [Imleria badia]